MAERQKWDAERPKWNAADVEWDETVDVICVGNSPGVLAYAICCAADDLDVLLVDPPAEPDAQLADWYAAMTEDLAPTLNPGRQHAVEDSPGFSLARVAPHPEPTGTRIKLETFVGEHLRQWSVRCAESSLGVMFTQVPELLLPMRTDTGESITAALLGTIEDCDLRTWLEDHVHDAGVREPRFAMVSMIAEYGRIAGLELNDGSLIGATGGLALPVGPDTAAVPNPLPGAEFTVALLGRPAGRFAMVDLLRR